MLLPFSQEMLMWYSHDNNFYTLQFREQAPRGSTVMKPVGGI